MNSVYSSKTVDDLIAVAGAVVTCCLTKGRVQELKGLIVDVDESYNAKKLMSGYSNSV